MQWLSSMKGEFKLYLNILIIIEQYKEWRRKHQKEK